MDIKHKMEEHLNRAVTYQKQANYEQAANEYKAAITMTYCYGNFIII